MSTEPQTVETDDEMFEEQTDELTIEEIAEGLEELFGDDENFGGVKLYEDTNSPYAQMRWNHSLVHRPILRKIREEFSDVDVAVATTVHQTTLYMKVNVYPE